MSLLPYVVNEVFNDIHDPFSPLYDQNFGVDLFDGDMRLSRPSLSTFTAPLRSGYVRTLRPFVLEQSGISSIKNEKDHIKINLDVEHFKPEEVNVKIADDYLIVEGKHEEKEDKHGFVSRQFTRSYRLPENVVKEKVTSTISSDGVLSITAPKKAESITHEKERQIPITMTNEPSKKQQQQDKGNESEKMES